MKDKTAESAMYESSFRYDDSLPDPTGKQWKQLKKILKALDTASFETDWKCLKWAPDFLSKAYQSKTIKDAFRQSGVLPYAPKKILSKCPIFKTLGVAKENKVEALIDNLADEVDEFGLVREIAFENILKNRYLLCPRSLESH